MAKKLNAEPSAAETKNGTPTISSEEASERLHAEVQEPFPWLFHGMVIFIVILGIFIVILAERWTSSPALKDAGLIFGGALIGFISLSFEEHFRARPERRRAKEHYVKERKIIESQREEERRRHEEERKEDLEKFLAHDSELRASKRRETDLQAQLELVGAHERSHIYQALTLGWLQDRRESNADFRRLFDSLVAKLELPEGISEEKIFTDLEEYAKFLAKILNALEVKYGPVVSGAFDLGCVLADLDKRGFEMMCRSDALRYLQDGLSLLKCDPGIFAAVGRFWEACKTLGKIPDEARPFFHNLFALVSGRFLEIPRSPDEDEALKLFIENPIKIPKVVRIENVSPLFQGKWTRVTVYGRPIVITKNKDGSFLACDLEDLPTNEEHRWQAWMGAVRGYDVRQESDTLILERKWGYADERAPLINLSVAPPSDPRNREPKEQFVQNVAPPPVGDKIVVSLGDRRIVVFNPDGKLHGIDEKDLLNKKKPQLILHQWDVRAEKDGLMFSRCWRYTDELSPQDL